jgi:opacity protein-like surface antigen
MRKPVLALLALPLLVLLCTAAHAQAVYPPKPTPALVGPYAGALFGRSEAKKGCIGLLGGGARACDETDLAFGVFAGYQLHRYYGVELGYNNLGKVSANSTGPASASSQNVHTDLWDLSATGILPIDDNLSAFARLGGYRASQSTSERGIADKSNFGLGYGAGLQWDFNRTYGVRVLWQRYKNVGRDPYGTNNYDVLGLSALYRFQ